MTKEEILKIKEHIEIHARREPRAVYITQIMWKAVEELEHIAELEKVGEFLLGKKLYFQRRVNENYTENLMVFFTLQKV